MEDGPDLRAIPIGSLRDMWLHLGGCCQRSSAYPLKLLASRIGSHHRLSDVLARLRCSECGRSPTRVILADRGDVSQWGAKGSVSIDLSPIPPP